MKKKIILSLLITFLLVLTIPFVFSDILSTNIDDGFSKIPESTTDINFEVCRDGYCLTSILVAVGSINDKGQERVIDVPTQAQRELKGEKYKFDIFDWGWIELTQHKHGIKEEIIVNKTIPLAPKTEEIFLEYDLNLLSGSLIYKDENGYTEWDGQSKIVASSILFYEKTLVVNDTSIKFLAEDYLYRLPEPIAYNQSTTSFYDEDESQNVTNKAVIKGKYELWNENGQIKLRIIFDSTEISSMGTPFTIDPAVDTRVDIANTGNGYANRAGSSKNRRFVQNSSGTKFTFDYIYDGSSGDLNMSVSSGTSYSSGVSIIDLGGTVSSILYTGDTRAITADIYEDVIYLFFDCHTAAANCLSKCNTTTGCDTAADWLNTTDGTQGYELFADCQNPDSLELINHTDMMLICTDESSPVEQDLIKYTAGSWAKTDLTSGSSANCNNGRLVKKSATEWGYFVRNHAGNDKTMFMQTNDSGLNWYNTSWDLLTITDCDSMQFALNESAASQHEPQACLYDSSRESYICGDRDITNSDAWFIKVNDTITTSELSTSYGLYSVSIGMDLLYNYYVLATDGTDLFVINSTNGGDTWGSWHKVQDTLSDVRGGFFIECMDASINTTALDYVFSHENTDDLFWSYYDVPYTSDEFPEWNDTWINESEVKINMNIQFNANWTDDIALSGFIFQINQTGSWVNASFVSMIGTSNISSNVTQVTAVKGTNVSFRFYANDSSDQWNKTDIDSFIVANTEPVMDSARIDPSPTAYANDTLEGWCNATDADSDTLNYYFWWYNGSSLFSAGRHHIFTGQELADSYVSTGSWEASYPVSEINDSDWSTYGSNNYGTGPSYLYMNYSKHSDFAGITWRVKDTQSGNYLEFDINKENYDCWTQESSVVEFRVEHDRTDGKWQCYDGSSWDTIRTFVGYEVFEENVSWHNITYVTEGIETNVDNLSSSYTAKGETWNITCMAFDGTDNSTNTTSNITIINLKPFVHNLTLRASDDPANETAADLTGDWDFYDVDSEDSQQTYETMWFNDSIEVTNLKNKSSVDSPNTTKGQVWIFSVRVYDGFEWSDWYNSSSLTILNTAPQMIVTELYPASPNINHNLTINMTCSDPDPDSLTAIWSVYKGGANQTALAGSGSITTDVETVIYTILSGNTSKNEAWFVRGWCYDGTDTTSYTESATRTIAGLLDLVLEAKGATEYQSGEVAKLAVQVKDSDGDPISGASCNISIAYPNDTLAVNSSGMTESSTLSFGAYYYNYTCPATEGVYLWETNCTNAGSSGYTLHAFHVAVWANQISDLVVNVTSIMSSISTIQTLSHDSKALLNCSTMTSNSNCYRLDLIQNYTDSLESGVTNLQGNLTSINSTIVTEISNHNSSVHSSLTTIATNVLEINSTTNAIRTNLNTANTSIHSKLDTIDSNVDTIVTNVTDILIDLGVPSGNTLWNITNLTYTNLGTLNSSIVARIWDYENRTLTLYETGAITISRTFGTGYVNQTFFSSHPSHILGTEEPESATQTFKYDKIKHEIEISSIPANITSAMACARMKSTGTPTGNFSVDLNGVFLGSDNATINTNYHWKCMNIPTSNVTEYMIFEWTPNGTWTAVNDYLWGTDNHVDNDFTHTSTDGGATYDEFSGEVIMYVEIESFETGTAQEVWEYSNRSLTDYNHTLLLSYLGNLTEMHNCTYTPNTTICGMLDGLQNYAILNYNLNVEINETTHDIFQFQHNTTINLSSSATWNITYGTSSNITCSSNYGTSSLFLNGASISSPYQINTSPVAQYNFSCNVSSSINWTSASKSQNLTINKAPSAINLTINGSESNLSLSVATNNIPINATLTTPSSGNLEVRLNGTLIYNGSSPTGNMTNISTEASYKINATYTGNENYSKGESIFYITYTIPSVASVSGASGSVWNRWLLVDEDVEDPTPISDIEDYLLINNIIKKIELPRTAVDIFIYNSFIEQEQIWSKYVIEKGEKVFSDCSVGEGNFECKRTSDKNVLLTHTANENFLFKIEKGEAELIRYSDEINWIRPLDIKLIIWNIGHYIKLPYEINFEVQSDIPKYLVKTHNGKIIGIRSWILFVGILLALFSYYEINIQKEVKRGYNNFVTKGKRNTRRRR